MMRGARHATRVPQADGELMQRDEDMTTWSLKRRAALACTAFVWLLLVAVGAHAADDFLDPNQAFRLSGRALDSRRIEVRFDIAPGYYLYREKFAAQASPDTVKLGELQMPKGLVKYDETFQKDVEYFHDQATMVVPIPADQRAPFQLLVTNQGCADKGLCYPPQQRTLQIEPGAAAGDVARVSVVADKQAELNLGGSSSTALSGLQSSAPVPAGDSNSDNQVTRALQSGNLWIVCSLFVLLGVGLAFTPCVLPMMPILSSIIVGREGRTSKAKGFSLALAYSVGMALVYTAFGIASALAGEGLGAALQNVWVVGAFALLLVILALSMLGAYELQMPARIQASLTQASGRMKGGQYIGVFVMGGLSALIVGPCVAAPLAGALLYISQTRDVVLGGAALFSMAAGMSVPLLLLGLSAGALLPRTGGWMESVKHLFGVLLLGVALWMVSPFIPAWLLMLATAVLLLASAVYLGAFERLAAVTPWRTFVKGVGLVLALMAGLQVFGLASGGRNLLQPLAHLAGGTRTAGVQASALKFESIADLSELDAAVAASTRPVMLDFYADWCVSCKEFEQFTFTDPAVHDKMAGMTLLRVDVTANNDQHKAMLRKYRLFGPPAMLFFAPAGEELASARVIGFQDADTFRRHLDKLDALIGVRAGG
jgi:thiol:disulfide interchange protein DsbD